jgi:hypothetical protein
MVIDKCLFIRKYCEFIDVLSEEWKVKIEEVWISHENEKSQGGTMLGPQGAKNVL